MTRFAWLQSRTQTIVAAAGLAAIAVTAAITGVQLAHLYNNLVAHCQTGCGLAISEFMSHDTVLQNALDLLSRAVPALFGIFWGAPLLTRELEAGTHRLAWTQSVTRSRWLMTRLAVVGGATVVVSGLLTLTITWWYRALDQVDSNQYAVFDRRDIAPIGYAFFAFASGTLIGAILRRTLPAMATTLGAFVFVRVADSLWIRPHLLPPLHKVANVLAAGQFGFESSNGSPVRLVVKGAGPPESWTLSSQIVTSSGHVAGSAQLSAFVRHYCPNVAPPPGHPISGRVVSKAGDPAAFDSCRAAAARTFHLVVTYQPANRYWTFQWLELGIFVALGLLALAGCYWWVTRHSN